MKEGVNVVWRADTCKCISYLPNRYFESHLLFSTLNFPRLVIFFNFCVNFQWKCPRNRSPRSTRRAMACRSTVSAGSPITTTPISATTTMVFLFFSETNYAIWEGMGHVFQIVSTIRLGTFPPQLRYGGKFSKKWLLEKGTRIPGHQLEKGTTFFLFFSCFPILFLK